MSVANPDTQPSGSDSSEHMNRLNCDSSRLAFVNESVPAALDHDVAPELERVNIVLLPIHDQRVSLGRLSEDG